MYKAGLATVHVRIDLPKQILNIIQDANTDDMLIADILACIIIEKALSMKEAENDGFAGAVLPSEHLKC